MRLDYDLFDKIAEELMCNKKPQQQIELKTNVSIMKKILVLSILALGLYISAQNIEKKCKSCGKLISQCQYKGRHPELRKYLI